MARLWSKRFYYFDLCRWLLEQRPSRKGRPLTDAGVCRSQEFCYGVNCHPVPLLFFPQEAVVPYRLPCLSSARAPLAGKVTLPWKTSGVLYCQPSLTRVSLKM